MTLSTEKATILAVDDTPENLDVVKGLLSDDYIVKAMTAFCTCKRFSASS